MNAAELADVLRQAVLTQDLGATRDPKNGGKALQHHPSLDLALVAFPPRGAPVCANVLFSREHPQGLIAPIGPEARAIHTIRYLADIRNGAGDSIAWHPDADWGSIPFRALHGSVGPRVVAPYPASLVKLMVLVGVAHEVDQGRTNWAAPLEFEGRTRPVQDWAFDMITISCNTSTSALVAHFHAIGAVVRRAGSETFNSLHDLFTALDLPTLRLANTRPTGGWRNADDSGVGQLQMTAWDTVRLLWWLDPDAPPPPWLPPNTPSLSAASQAVVMHALREQGLHEILSSSLLEGVRGWRKGLPARLPARWRRPDGSTHVGDHVFPPSPHVASPEVEFAHKTGNTENYASDAGIVRGLTPHRRHYIVALISNLGSRYAPDPRVATTWRLPALGAAIDSALKPWLEGAQ